MVGHSLMNYAYEMWSARVELEGEAASCVSLGTAGFLHSIHQAEEDNVVAGCRLVSGAVGDRAGEISLIERKS